MQKIIIDTNVFVSSLIQKGYSNYIVSEIFLTDDIEICISDELFEEYYDVLNRKRFSKYPDFVSSVTYHYRKKGRQVFPLHQTTHNF